ncbi:MAG: hypothetical protein ACOY3M_04065 [Patescibacteria group bacterium]
MQIYPIVDNFSFIYYNSGMVMTETLSRLSRVERTRVRDLIAKQPTLPFLAVGYHLRNEAEAKDMLELLDAFAPNRSYAGLAGCRKAGVVIHSERRLRMKYRDAMSLATIRGIRREWPLVAGHVDGRLPLELPTVKHEKLANRPANRFFYDIDIAVIDNDATEATRFEAEIGTLSGTKIELFILSPRRLLAEGHPFYPSIFYNSLRLPYPYIWHRKKVNFDRIFAGWRKEGRKAKLSVEGR